MKSDLRNCFCRDAFGEQQNFMRATYFSVDRDSNVLLGLQKTDVVLNFLLEIEFVEFWMKLLISYRMWYLNILGVTENTWGKKPRMEQTYQQNTSQFPYPLSFSCFNLMV